MNRTTLKKWGFGVLALAIVAVLGSLAWVNYQLKRFSGAFTETVDRSQFMVPLKPAVITDVAVLSADGKTMIPGQTVLLADGNIISISDTADVPSGALIIDGSGRFLVPGFVDSHVHLRQSPNDLLLYLANGVTHIVEMSGNANHLEWRQRTGNGLIGPRMFIASEKLGNWSRFDGHFQRWTRNRINVGTPDNAASVVQTLVTDGYDAIKLGTFVDRDTYHAVNAAAAEAGIPVIGHLPLSIEFDDVPAAGQDQIAHIEELVKLLNAEFGYYNSRNGDEFLGFVAERGDEIAKGLRENGVAVSTTLWLMESVPRQKFDFENVLKEVELEYVNPGLVEGTPLSAGWLPHHHPYQLEPGADEARREVIRRYWMTHAGAHRVLLRILVENDVILMAGTDANNAVAAPGFSLHDELKALVDAGMTPAQSLRAATATPAEWMHNGAGRIAPGYRADLVLLNANPLDDIENTRHIEAVVVGGRVIDYTKREAMLEAVRQANERSRSASIELLTEQN